MFYIYDKYIVNIVELLWGDTFGFLEGVDDAFPQADGAESFLWIDCIWGPNRRKDCYHDSRS